ncbi:hypothetical protein [Mycoplasma suis]|uniref:Uncharacterized protein n=1 Tax=Mycoplasma suis (strain Illinois) TaxID=768700 RepID=F0QQI8_MYCSL|nr:hypothetical protein [Mycoplasma suis]ADX97758.1 hypothetical protein MSU_0214 [Mycoplasma suis str. Illinois]
MIGGILTKKLIPSILGIAGVFGGGGIGLTSLLMRGTEEVKYNSGPSVKSEVPREAPKKVEEQGYKYATEKSRVAAVFIYRDQIKSGDNDKPICHYWVDTVSSRDGVQGTIEEKECLEVMKEVGNEVDMDKPFKFVWADSIHISNILKRFFSSASSNDAVEKYYLTENEWTLNEEWKCNNSRDSKNKEIISCNKLEVTKT